MSIRQYCLKHNLSTNSVYNVFGKMKDKPETEAKEPEKTFPVENGTMAILCAGALLFVLLYYFKIYKPSHEEEEEDEGIETGDGFPTERED